MLFSKKSHRIIECSNCKKRFKVRREGKLPFFCPKCKNIAGFVVLDKTEEKNVKPVVATPVGDSVRCPCGRIIDLRAHRAHGASTVICTFCLKEYIIGEQRWRDPPVNDSGVWLR